MTISYPPMGMEAAPLLSADWPSWQAMIISQMSADAIFQAKIFCDLFLHPGGGS